MTKVIDSLLGIIFIVAFGITFLGQESGVMFTSIFKRFYSYNFVFGWAMELFSRRRWTTGLAQQATMEYCHAYVA